MAAPIRMDRHPRPRVTTRRVLGIRLEGAPPTAVVEFAGIPDRIAYPAAQTLERSDGQTDTAAVA